MQSSFNALINGDTKVRCTLFKYCYCILFSISTSSLSIMEMCKYKTRRWHCKLISFDCVLQHSRRDRDRIGKRLPVDRCLLTAATTPPWTNITLWNSWENKHHRLQSETRRGPPLIWALWNVAVTLGHVVTVQWEMVKCPGQIRRTEWQRVKHCSLLPMATVVLVIQEDTIVWTVRKIVAVDMARMRCTMQTAKMLEVRCMMGHQTV